jgi:Protein of unknown function (DUF559)
MSRRPPVPQELRRGPFDRRTGLEHVTAGQLRGSAYERLGRGVYARAGGPRTHLDRIRALRTVLPPDAVLGGLSAASALGALVAAPSSAVEIVLPPARRVRRRPGLVVRGDVLVAGEAVPTPFGRSTSGARTAFDLARRLILPASVVRALPPLLASGRPCPDLSERLIAELGKTVGQVDSVLRATGTAAPTVAEVAARHPRSRGLRAQRLVLALCDPRAESFPESAVRVRIALAGLPPPIPQYLVRDGQGTVVARADFAWPAVRLVLEYDGGHHNDRRQFSRDRDRDNRIHLAGWRVLHVDALHLRNPAQFIQTLSDALTL